MTGFDPFDEEEDPPQRPGPPALPPTFEEPDDQVEDRAGFYRQFFQNQRARLDQRVDLSFGQALRANPDLAGEAQRLGGQLGLSSLVAERNIERARAIAQKRRLAELSPGVRRAMLDHEFARVAHDDLDNVGLLEDLASKALETPFEMLSIAKVALGVASDTDRKRFFNIVGRGVQERLTVQRGVLGTQVIGQGMTEEARQTLDRINRMRGVFPHTSPGFVSGLAGMIGQMSQTLPVIAGTAAAGAAVGAVTGPGALVLGGASGTAAIFTTSAMIEGGNQALDLIEQGVDPGTARGIGAMVGGVNGLLEVVGFKALSFAARQTIRDRITKGAVEGLTAMTTRRAAGRAASAYGIGLGGEVGTELAQEVTNILAETAAGVGPEDLGEVWDRLGGIVAETVAGTAFLAGIGPAARFASDLNRAQKGVASREFFQDLQQATKASKVRVRSPSKFLQFLQRNLDGTPAENLYLDPERAQEATQEVGITDQQLAQELPGVHERLQQALQTGGDLVIPTAEYEALVADTPLGEALQPHLRLDPDSLSFQEAEQFFQGGQDEQFRSEAERLVEEQVEQQDQFQASADRTRDRMDEQLRETGRFSRRDARDLATLQRAFITTQAAEMGLTPEQFEARFGLKVIAGGEVHRLAPQLERGEQFEQAENIPSGIPEGQQAPAQLFSALAQQVDQATFKATSKQGLRSTLKGLVKKGAVKQDEIDATGLNDWLELQEGKVTKAQVQEFLANNGVNVERVQLGGAEREQLTPSLVDLDEQLQETLGNIEEIRENAPLDQSGNPALEEDLNAIEELEQRAVALNNQISAQERGEGGVEQAARFGEYVVPGGENYREILLTLDRDALMTDADRDLLRRGRAGVQGFTPEEFQRFQALSTTNAAQFRSSHFPENPNIVAHIRMDDRTDADGNRVLFVQELQSDWAQKGRKEGFRSEENTVAAFYETQTGQRVDIGFGDSAESAIQNARDAGWDEAQQERLGVQTGPTEGDRPSRGIPLAPFVTSTKGWLNLALKQVLLEAVNGNYDSVAFITGEQSAAFYDLSKQVDEVAWLPLTPDENRQRGLGGVPHGRLTASKDGEVLDVSAPDVIAESELPDFIGKEPAQRLLSAPKGSGGLEGEVAISGEDLRVGGQGMLEFYDRIVPQAANKLVKKLGGPKKLGTVDISEGAPPAPRFTIRERSDGSFLVVDPVGTPTVSFDTEEAAQREADLQTDRLVGRFVVRESSQGQFFIDSPETEAGTVDVQPTREEAERVAEELTEARRQQRPVGFRVERDGQQFVILGPEDRPISFRETQEEADAEVERLLRDPALSAAEQPGVEITDELRQSVQGGLPLFQAGEEQDPRGGFFPENLTAVLYEKGDVSTFLHESAHYYLTVLGQMVASPNAPDRAVQDMDTFLEWAEIDSFQAWQGMTLAQQRKAHEKFALSFELYIHEGKAPSRELETVFERFRRFLRNFYVHIRDRLNAIFRKQFGEDLPGLTPEIRGVFDRLVASDEAITQIEAERDFAPLFQTQQEAGYTDEQWEQYQRNADRTHESSVTDLTKRSLRTMQWLSNARSGVLKDRQDQHQTLREEIRKDEAERIRRQPVYRAIHFLRRGEFITELGEVQPGPDNSRMNTEAARALLPEGKTLSDLRGMTNQRGMDPDMVAESFGFGSGKELIEAILAADPQQEVVDQATDQRMLDEHGEILDGDAIEGEVQRALHNDARTRFAAVEWKFLSGSGLPIRMINAQAKRSARQALARQPINQIRHRDFSLAAGRAARQAREASRSGDSVTARQKILHELLQHHLAAESLKVQDEIAKVWNLKTNTPRGFFRKLQDEDSALGKTRDIDLVRVARSVLSVVGAGRRPETGQEQDLLSDANATVQQNYPALFAGVQSIRDRLAQQPIADLVLEDFRDLVEVSQSAWELSRIARTMELEGRRVELDELKTLLMDQVLTLPEIKAFGRKIPEGQTPSWAARRIQRYWHTLPAFKRFQHYAKFLDGDNPNGPFQRFVLRPMFTAIDTMLGTKLELMRRLRASLKAVRDQAGARWDQRIQARADELPNPANPSEGFVFRGKRELIDVWLDMGNDSNLAKRLVGEGWAPNPRETEGVLQRGGWDRFVQRMWNEGFMNQADLDFIELVGREFEALRPLAQKAQREVFGAEFKEIEIGEVLLPNGKRVRGWYAPLRIDQTRARRPRVRNLQDIESIEGLVQDYQYSAQPIGPTKGFTIERNPNFYDRLSMDIGRRIQAFDEELRFINLMPHTKAMVRLFVHDREMSAAMTDYDPEMLRGILLPWLRTSSRQVVSEPGNFPVWDAMARLMRLSTGVAYLGWNLATSLIQTTGLVNSLVDVQPRFLWAGWQRFLRNPIGAWQEAMEDNPRMRDRLDRHGERIWDWLGRQGAGPIERGVRLSRSEGGRIAMFPIVFMQNIVDLITWHGAFQQAIAKSPDSVNMNDLQQDARVKANEAVERAQGSRQPEALAPFEVGTPSQKLLTQFLNFSNGVLNLILGGRTPLRRAGRFLWVVSLLTLFETALRSLAQGAPDDEDGDGVFNDIAQELGENFARNATGMIPVIGPAAAGLIRGEADRLSVAPAASLLRTAWAGVEALFDEDEFTARDTRSIGILLTLITGGVPIAPAVDRLAYLQAVESGEVVPTSDWDFIRGILTGRSSEGSRR